MTEIDREDAYMDDTEVEELYGQVVVLKRLLVDIAEHFSQDLEENIHRAPNEWKEDADDLNYFCHVCRSWNHGDNPNCRMARIEALLPRIQEALK